MSTTSPGTSIIATPASFMRSCTVCHTFTTSRESPKTPTVIVPLEGTVEKVCTALHTSDPEGPPPTW